MIEDNFCAGRPDLDVAGAIFSDVVHDYEAMKLRVLNGGHQLISVPGELLGIETISGCMVHEGIRSFLHHTIAQEVIPNVKSVPGMTPEGYLELIERRFSNVEIVDTTRRVAFDGSSRQPGFIIPSIRDALLNGQPIEGLALMSALWMRYCKGERDNGSSIQPNDPKWQELNAVAQRAGSIPHLWLEQSQYYGEISSDKRFRETFVKWAELLDVIGTEETLKTFASKILQRG